jgi:hypothetical protein
LKVPLGTSSFTSSFIKDALLEDVWHGNLFPKMGDAHVAFKILTHYFMQQLLYLLRYTLPSSTFIKSFTSFDSSLLQMFGRLLDPGCFNNPKRFLACKQASLPITFGGIGLVLIATITSIVYLRSWALVASIIVIRFMVDQCPFLLEALTQINNNTFPFQQHFKAPCDLLPPPACACFASFEQLIK